MAALGGWAIYFGYGIVQVERGWSALIAGATLLSGGVVTVGLGAVVQRLGAIRKALVAAGIFVPAEAEAPPPSRTLRPAEPAVIADPVIADPVIADSVAPTIEPPRSDAPGFDAPRHAEPVLEQDRFAEMAEPDADPPPARQPTTADPAHSATQREIDDAWRAVDEELTNSDWAKALLATDAAAGAVHPAVAEPAPPYPEDRGLQPLDAAALASDAAPAHDEPHHAALEVQASPVEEPAAPVEPAEVLHPPPDAHPPAAGTDDDDYRDLLGPVPGAPEPAAAAPMAHDPAAHDPAAPVAAAPDPAAPDPAAALDHPPADPADPQLPPPAVIGRYEADGTTYTMFSDGSIEARSPEGVYRFGSMAELKSFIEQAP